MLWKVLTALYIHLKASVLWQETPTDASGKAVASELDRRAVGSTAQCQNRAQVPTTLINQKVYNKS